MDIDARDWLNKTVIAVTNAGSGSVNSDSAARMAEIFAQAGLPNATVVSAEPHDIDSVLVDAVGKADVLVVLGGDGTIRSAADKCGTAGKLIIPLPGGTMNMLPHALFGNVSWEEALIATLSSPRIRSVSGGSVGGQPFFCAAILGAPALWADAREALREGRLAEAAKRSLTAVRRSSELLDYQLGGEVSGEAAAVAIICPLVSNALDAQEPSLEAAALRPVEAGEMFRLAFHSIFDDWRQDPSVTLARVTSVIVSGHGRVPVILDGEKVYMGRVVKVSFVPVAFRALIPTPAIVEPSS